MCSRAAQNRHCTDVGRACAANAGAPQAEQGLASVASWQPVAPRGPGPHPPHRLLEARSLTMYAFIAAKMRGDPALLSGPRRNLGRWGQRWGIDVPRWAVQWRRILDGPWPENTLLISEPGEEAARRRQSLPLLTLDSAQASPSTTGKSTAASGVQVRVPSPDCPAAVRSSDPCLVGGHDSDVGVPGVAAERPRRNAGVATVHGPSRSANPQNVDGRQQLPDGRCS